MQVASSSPSGRCLEHGLCWKHCRCHARSRPRRTLPPPLALPLELLKPSCSALATAAQLCLGQRWRGGAAPAPGAAASLALRCGNTLVRWRCRCVWCRHEGRRFLRLLASGLSRLAASVETQCEAHAGLSRVPGVRLVHNRSLFSRLLLECEGRWDAFSVGWFLISTGLRFGRRLRRRW